MLKGDRLKALRKSRGLKQQDVAMAVEIHPAMIGYYEREMSFPKPRVLIKLCDFFEVSADYLLGRSEAK